MPVSHKYKVVFVHIHKTAGSSIDLFMTRKDKEYGSLKNYCGKIVYSDKAIYLHHANAKDMKKQFKSVWDNYFKFSFVRNPWDRVVSCWKDKASPAHCDSWPDSVYCKARNDTFSKFVTRIINTEFIEFINESEFSIADRHVLSQTVLIPDDTDFIGRFENLQEDFNTICDKIGIPQQQLAHINKTEHTHYAEYYTDETREIVANKYSKDIKHFGYKFDYSK